MFDKEHRKILHDAGAVEAIRRQYGDGIATVAMHHIYIDSPTRYVDSAAMQGVLVDAIKTRRKKS